MTREMYIYLSPLWSPASCREMILASNSPVLSSLSLYKYTTPLILAVFQLYVFVKNGVVTYIHILASRAIDFQSD
jgi:hypothetical protein